MLTFIALFNLVAAMGAGFSASRQIRQGEAFQAAYAGCAGGFAFAVGIMLGSYQLMA